MKLNLKKIQYDGDNGISYYDGTRYDEPMMGSNMTDHMGSGMNQQMIHP
ncbi:hypothetical protein NMT12_100004 [metagenome]